MRNITLVVLGAAVCGLSGVLYAQTVHPDIPDGELAQIGKDLDKRQFDAFNHCDFPALTDMYAPDAEFYHDLNGKIFNRDQFLAAVKRNICGKTQRRLIESSLEVYPMAKIGLVLSGRHCFYRLGESKCIQSGRFYMLWKFDGKDWHMSRVFSYDHQDMD